MNKRWISLMLFCFTVAAPVVALEGGPQVVVKEENASGIKGSVMDVIKRLSHENKAVSKQLSSFLQALKQGEEEGIVSLEDAKKIRRAAVFAAKKHKDHLRKNAEETPYIIHPLGVADQIMRIGHVYDADVLVAALLHDSIENTDATYAEISEKFGSVAANYIKEVTDDHNLPMKVRKKMQIIHAFHQSEGATLIRLSDKLHNLHTLRTDPPAGWTQDKVDQYFQWAQAVIDNLPTVNSTLKEAVHQEIATYWEAQEKS